MLQYLTFKHASDNKPRKAVRTVVLRKTAFWYVLENDMLGVSCLSLLSIISDESQLFGSTDRPGRTRVCRQPGR